ncbi:hypothetical protein CR513_37422, partial [Mucuna pruriens]
MVLTIFPLEINEAYNYFGEKSSSVPGYRLVSFVASQAITWIMAWEYTIIQQYETVDIKTVCCQTKSSQEAKRRKGSIILIKEAKDYGGASATSTEEFEATLLKARSILDSDNGDHYDAESSESNSYLRNGDMFD